MQHRRRQRSPQHEAEASGEGRGRGGGMALAQGQAEERGIAGHRRRQRPAEGEESQGIHAAGADGQQRQADVRSVERFRGTGLFRSDRHPSSGRQLGPRYFPTAPLSVAALRSSAAASAGDISGQITSLTPSLPTTLGSESATS